MRMTQKHLRELKQLREIATMERAHFHLPGSGYNDGPKDTAAIKEATKAWRETWLIAPLDILIAEGERELKK